MAQQPINVKKVKAYPIDASIKAESATVPSRIVKLTLSGFLVEVSSPNFKVGDKFEISFDIPVIRHPVHEQAVVVKAYHQFAGGSGWSLAEMHFRTLNDASRERIAEFLRQIGQ